MKTKIENMLTFFVMVIVLGTQCLLQGSWTIKETENMKSDNNLQN